MTRRRLPPGRVKILSFYCCSVLIFDTETYTNSLPKAYRSNMSFSDTSSLQYSIRGTRNDTDAQILILRFGFCSRLVSRSPGAGIPDIILQQSPSTLLGETQIPFPLWDIEEDSQFRVFQFLSSFNLRYSACEILFQKIYSFAQQLAAGNVMANFCIEADIHLVKMLWIEPISNAAAEDMLVLDFEDDYPPMRGAPDSAIERLKQQKIDGSWSGVEEIGDCSVCYDDLNDGKEVTKMPCGHLYHESCILTWLQRSNSCPLCRAPLEEQ